MTEVESSVRKFSKEGKKVTNQGYVSETEDSLTFMHQFAQQLSSFGLDAPASSETTENVQEKKKSSTSSAAGREETRHHKVIILGPSGVGKASLCQQFQTSENEDIFHPDSTATYGDDSTEVHLELNGILWKLTFISMPSMSWLGLVHGDENVRNTIDAYEPSAYNILYAVDDKSSLHKASQVLAHLDVSGAIQDKVVVLVATKSDLVRARVVSTSAGKALAAKYGAKFIEISSGIGHNVDELLVGIVTQLQLRREARPPPASKTDFKKRVKIVMGRIKPSGSSKDVTDIMK